MDVFDKELIELSQTGDNEAFAKLVKIYEKDVFNLCYRLTNDDTEAKDIFQETFLNAFKNIRRFKKESEFFTWLYRITCNVWKQKMRYNKRRLEYQHFSLDANKKKEDNKPVVEIAENQAGLTEGLEKKEKVQMAQKVLSELNEEERMVIVLRDIEKKSYQEMAQILNFSVGTIKSRLSRARNVFRVKFLNYMTS